MIRGVVTDEFEGWIDLAIVGDDQSAIGFSGVIDTGFSGSLTLPLAVIERFGGQRVGIANVYLADGSRTFCHIFKLTILWDGRPLTIEVDAAETEPLIGMGLLAGLDLQMRVVPNGEVIIIAIPI